jgi:hypothetical protein
MRKETWVALAAAMMMVFTGCQMNLPDDANDPSEVVTDPGAEPTRTETRKTETTRTETPRTELIWQNEKIGHSTREKAIVFCNDLTLNNITSWRLPTSAESKKFHREMNAKGDVPVQAFDHCTAEVTEDGYIRTLKGSQRYGGEPGDAINFRGSANIRCVSGGGD